MTKRRVVVTGLGVLCPIGNTADAAWASALAGRSGAATIDSFDTVGQSVTIAAAVKDFDVEPYMARREARRLDTFIQYGMAAGIQAVRDAGLEDAADDGDRIGVAIGSGIGGINTIEATHSTYLNRGASRVSPFFVPSSVINMIAGNLSIRYGFRGPNLALVTACTTGTHNIGLGTRLIEYGEADVMVVGGSEQAHLAGNGGWLRLHARPLHPQRRSGTRQPALGPRPGRLRAR